jgi:hypothetical protein
MTPIEIHNELLAGRIIKHLQRRNFNATTVQRQVRLSNS